MSRPKAACGTLSAYTRGCKCPECFAAGQTYRNDRDSDPEKKAKHRASTKKYRETERGKASQRAHRVARVSALRAEVTRAKSVPCFDCHVRYPYYVLDFDHRPDEVKLFNVASYARNKPTLEALQAEIMKCDVVCSNCHRERTHQRKVKRHGA